MSAVTLYPNYVRRLASSYKALRANEPADQHVLEGLHRAAKRCLRAHMRAELQLTQDVILPLPTVLAMLEYVHDRTAELLEPMPTPEDLAPTPLSAESRSFLRKALERIQQLVAA